MPACIHRIVATNIVSESSLPYGMEALDTPEKSYGIWQEIVAADPSYEPDKECLVVFLLNSRLAPYSWNLVSLGSLESTAAHPREILRPVIAGAAAGFVIMHNHPSGNPEPSRADHNLTMRMVEACKIMDIRLLDHVVVGKPWPGRSAYYSFREAGIIP
jgi:DNA repair protein RadC